MDYLDEYEKTFEDLRLFLDVSGDFNNRESFADVFNFSVGDVLLDVDKSRNVFENIDASEISNDVFSQNFSEIYNSDENVNLISGDADNFFADYFDNSDYGGVSGVSDYAGEARNFGVGGFNCNSYNEVNVNAAANAEDMLASFTEKLAESLTSAAERAF